jgi:uncharacterized protein YeaO (DUF488 family)
VLAPSRELLSEFKEKSITFETFARRYRGEMHAPDPSHVIQLVAAMAMRFPLALGCFCVDPEYCHRSILYQLVKDAAGSLPKAASDSPHAKYFSPPCSMPEIEE